MAESNELSVAEIIHGFFKTLENDEEYELLNEASLQNELAFYLKQNYKKRFKKVQLERNVRTLGAEANGKKFIKKEMDIYLLTAGDKEILIELKFPPGKSYERRVFHTYKDVLFGEQLIDHLDFEEAYALFICPEGNGKKYKEHFGCKKGTEEFAFEQETLQKNKYWIGAKSKKRKELVLQRKQNATWQKLNVHNATPDDKKEQAHTYDYFVVPITP